MSSDTVTAVEPTPRPAPPVLTRDVQLERLQQQLADYTDCPSAHTAEGKAQIERIEMQMQRIEDALRASEQRRPPTSRSLSTGGQLDTWA